MIALFFGLKAATLAVVIEAVLRIGKKALKNRVMVYLAALAFIGIFFFEVPFPVIVLAAGAIGLIGGRVLPDRFCVIRAPAADEDDRETVIHDRQVAKVRPSWGRAAGVTAVGLAVWFGPVALLFAWVGPSEPRSFDRECVLQ